MILGFKFDLNLNQSNFLPFFDLKLFKKDYRNLIIVLEQFRRYKKTR